MWWNLLIFWAGSMVGFIMGWVICALMVMAKDDAADNRMWDPEACRRPPLRGVW